jgi:thiamine-phosphate pyrophosphorylase
MRFDLTNASYRVFDRASRWRLPTKTSEISAAKLLLSLFEEEECRAADWLSAAGLSLEQFQTAFGIQTLQSPISAPPFSMGSYGVPVGQYQAPSEHQVSIEATPAGNNSPPVGDLPPENHPKEKQYEEHETPQPQPEPDEWTSSNPNEKRYSLYPQYRTETFLGEGTMKGRLRFCLDDQPVDVGRIAPELESALELLTHRLMRHEKGGRQILLSSGGVATIAEGMASFTLATEHLLLAAVLDEGDVGRWLCDHGFDAVELYERIDPKQHHKETDVSTSASDEPLADLRPRLFEEHSDIYRILDAAANRSREAVRVLEDFVRFVLNDPTLTRQLKEFRHKLQDVLSSFPLQVRLEARNTEQDVGTEMEADGEYRRPSIHDVLSANFARLQESLRSLEEFSKHTEPLLARRFEQLRYRCYTLHKIVALTVPSLPNFPSPLQTERVRVNGSLYVLVDIRETEEEFASFVKAIIDGGADIIQLRDKTANDRTVLARSRILKEQIAVSGCPVLFVMNDRPDLALAAGADGVHVGQEELPATAVRRIVGNKMLVGVSTHNIEQARQAVADGADYIGAGPVFESSTKEFSQLAGLDFLREVAAEIELPAFAIGGITLENAAEVLKTGITRFAVRSALLQAEEPQTAAKNLKRILAE